MAGKMLSLPVEIRAMIAENLTKNERLALTAACKELRREVNMYVNAPKVLNQSTYMMLDMYEVDKVVVDAEPEIVNRFFEGRKVREVVVDAGRIEEFKLQCEILTVVGELGKKSRKVWEALSQVKILNLHGTKLTRKFGRNLKWVSNRFVFLPNTAKAFGGIESMRKRGVVTNIRFDRVVKFEKKKLVKPNKNVEPQVEARGGNANGQAANRFGLIKGNRGI
ncbi:hypothetical protein BNJ_00030 [Kaumoebavirus]|uniref:hypothetical protein n=1 Tax=Kaumoebavirus TaxID=1859492 RepID=UPI0009C1D0EE|nr:hypothetical protein BNJ_00030 [Kaumoebavirus]ARA71873.1 hypothetical protein BNJ_00030 [Kaumoebavirus]